MVRIKLENTESVSPEVDTKVKESRKDKQKKKLRSLVKVEAHPKDKTQNDCDNETTNELVTWRWKRIVVAVVIALASVFMSSIDFSSCGFWATYERNYNKIMHGDENFCHRNIDPLTIVQKLNKQIVGQEDSIKLIEGALNLANREKIIQLAFVGETGVGKTFIGNIMMENFKWQPAISLIFDINFQVHLSGEEAFESDAALVIPRLSECGFNLVVIDDIEMRNDTIERIIKLERNLHRLAKQALFKTVFVAIFNGNYNASTLQNDLKDFVLVEFQPFNEVLFQQCIEIHEKLNNIKLKPKDLEELKLINFTESGCKTVAKKLNLIAKG